MTKVRIGNDINLSVDLRQYLIDRSLKEHDVYSGKSRSVYGINSTDAEDVTIYDKDFRSFENIDKNGFVNKSYEVYYPYPKCCCGGGEDCTFRGEGMPLSIHSVKAILVNVTKKELAKEYKKEYKQAMRNYYNALRKHSRFIARFPIEPAMECFNPTPHDICTSGYPTYRAYPHSRHYRVLGPHYYAMAPYHGFGVRPHWEGVYKPMYPLPPLPPELDESKISEKNSIYYAQVAATNKQNIIEVLFPAKDQIADCVGEYKLILVIKVFVAGYNASNTKTITVDIPNVFKIVDSTDETAEVIEDLDGKKIIIHNGVSVKVNSIVDSLSQVGWCDCTNNNTNPDVNPGTSSDDDPDSSNQHYVPQDDVYINSVRINDNGIINLDRTDEESVEVDLRGLVGWGDPDWYD